MLDKNGIEIKTGDIVRVSGAYFKNDNGLYFVDNSEGDPSWSGTDHCLKKITKKGKISTAKYNICFWPLMITVSGWEKRAAARAWNEEHAEIEVITDIDQTEIANHFLAQASQIEDSMNYYIYNFGEESNVTKKQIEIKEHYKAVAERITA